MFFIYGGGFVAGASSEVNFGPYFLMEEEVILVSFNYRVGPYGFLSTGDDFVSGNAGLKDQNLALKWVNQYISYFGGDPTKITIFGQSAGSASCAYHIMSPLSKGLFRGAILYSGTTLSPWAYQRNHQLWSRNLIKLMDPMNYEKYNTSKTIYEYLKQAPADRINKASLELQKYDYGYTQLYQGFFFAPVYEHEHDGAFITKRAYEALEEGDFNKVSVMLSATSEEDYFYMDNQGNLGQISKRFTETNDSVPDDMHAIDGNRGKIKDEMMKFYTSGGKYADNLRKKSASRTRWHMVKRRHIYSIQIILDITRRTQLSSLSKTTLNPTPVKDELLQNIIWPKTDADFTYLDIGSDMVVKKHMKNEMFQFWNKLYTQYVLSALALSALGQGTSFDPLDETYKNDLIVNTTTGLVRGGYGGKTVGKGRDFFRFRSIPYAEPPLGELRFELPKKSNNLPVMVWIYGGAFFAGAANFDEHGPDYLLDEDVILVSFHYRTGIFGFLSTGDEVAPGNAGLKDQNKEAEGLFNRAILQSGSTLCQWALSRVASKTTSDVAKRLKVDTSTSEDMVKGLKAIPADKLQDAWSRELFWKLLADPPLRGLPLGPVMEHNHSGAIIVNRSYELLEKGKFHRVPILIGHTSLEMSTDADRIPVSRILGGKIKDHYFKSKSIAKNLTQAMEVRVAHTEDLGYIFDYKHQGSNADSKVRDRMVRMWANFAKTGNPTPEADKLLDNITWLPNTKKDRQLKTLVIDEDLHMDTSFESEEIKFWDNIFKSYGAKPYNELSVTMHETSSTTSINKMVVFQNKEAEDLFNRAILQSGSTLCQWPLSLVAPKTTSDVARRLKVDTSTSEDMVKGLKAIPADKLQDAWSRELFWKLLADLPLRGLPLSPVMEHNHSGAIIVNRSYELLEKGKFHRVPILIGHISLEMSTDADRIPVSRILGGKIKDHYFKSKSIAKNLTQAMELLNNITWLPNTKKDRQLKTLVMGENLYMDTDLESDKIKFWGNIFKSYGTKLYSTY
nr:unnamed protein product [Callosobruchus analis]